MRKLMLRVCAAVVLLAGACLAGENGKKVKRAGPLAKLPSKPGAHLAKIKALGDNAWLNLGSPAPDSKWGPGRGRSWSAKMSYVPDLGGAFLVGQGKHGYIRPDGRYDDIYFYDANAHQWVCVYPGINTKTFVQDIKAGKLKVNDDGQMVDKDGQPILYAYGGHSYQSHAYDRDNRKWVTLGGGGGLGGDQYSVQMAWDKAGKKLLKEQMTGKADKVWGSPFLFNTVTGKFERKPFASRGGGGVTGGVLFYLPTRKKLWTYGQGRTMLGDPVTRKWQNSGAKGGPLPSGIDFGGCYDTKRHRVYVAGGSYRKPWGRDEGRVYIYDVASNTWSNPKHRGAAPPHFGANTTAMHYDAANDTVVALVFGFGEGKGRGVYLFDPVTQKWAAKPLPFAKDMSGGCGHGFYDPKLNAHFLYRAGDSDDRGAMWVWRCKRSKTGK